MAPCWMVMPMVPAFTKTPKEVKPWGLKRCKKEDLSSRNEDFCINSAKFKAKIIILFQLFEALYVFRSLFGMMMILKHPYFWKGLMPATSRLFSKLVFVLNTSLVDCLCWENVWDDWGPRLINIVMRGSITSEQWYGNTCSHVPVQTYSWFFNVAMENHHFG